MRFTIIFLAIAFPITQAANIVLSNGDGWAGLNIRTFFEALSQAGYSIILSAPAIDHSGAGSKEATPTKLDGPCQYGSCPPGSPAVNYDEDDYRLHYVNSFPATAMMIGIEMSPEPPDIALAGINVGATTGLTTVLSGNVGAATKAVKLGIPAIAFSGAAGERRAWYVLYPPQHLEIYTVLSNLIVSIVLASGKPYLPPGTWLNVNFPAINDDDCEYLEDWHFVLSRMHRGGDVVCEGRPLPTEQDVISSPWCLASISVGNARTKRDASAVDMLLVAQKFQEYHLMMCLPTESEEARYRESLQQATTQKTTKESTEETTEETIEEEIEQTPKMPGSFE